MINKKIDMWWIETEILGTQHNNNNKKKKNRLSDNFDPFDVPLI